MNLSSKKFRSLSLKDLLDAREHYHIHLMNKRNVTATAIGRYRFRRGAPDPSQKKKAKSDARKDQEPKTLQNTEVRRYSWPCVMVFVRDWVNEEDFVPDEEAGYDDTKTALSDMVPKTLFLPDGLEVPVCVIEAEKAESGKVPVDFKNLKFPENIIGGGYPVLADVQKQEHLATLGCLVTDGHFTYALTNRHVSGDPGETLYTFLDGDKVRIGRSARKQLTRKKFSEVYEKWPGAGVYLNMDIGLIEIDDLNRWTAQIYGIGTLGQMVDLSDHTISLDLIGSKVKAFGCASRQMKGEILGLFYRYKAIGGYEYVADFLIGKRKGRTSPPFYTNHGDSAAIWMLEDARGPEDAGNPGEGRVPKDAGGPEDTRNRNRPIAIQWGGHVFLEGAKTTTSRYALATCLSTVCNELELDLVRDLNIGLDEYWGRMGHYTIGNIACNLIANRKLKQLMQANLTRISFEQGDITDKNPKGLNEKGFVPLANVPDDVWKGRPPMRPNEGPNHFADMDQKDKDGRDLLTLCRDPENVSVDVWKAFYTRVKARQRGLLPFRVWQIYDAMVDSVKQGNASEFVCAAGILSHYVGDCSNPLHISYMYNGIPSEKDDTSKKKPKSLGEGIHSAYENGMLGFHKDEILAGLNAMAADNVSLENVTGGREAAIRMVELMTGTYERLDPEKMITVYITLGKKSGHAVADVLWDHFGKQTTNVLFDSCRYLALLWDSAWEEGKGDKTMKKLDEIDTETLMRLYMRDTFLPSFTLNQIGEVLR